MRVSISVTNYSWPGELPTHLDTIARTADETGVDTVWVADHLLQADPFADPAHTEHLEALTTLGFLAARTERVRLGAMVACVTFRPPAMLIKAISTLAVLSGGRAWFGVGAGHQEDEARAMGLPFPATGRRFEQLAETLQLARQMWDGDEKPFVGKHFRLDHPVNSPNPATRPRILVGGAGERRTLPLVAAHADACNLFDIPDGGATVRRKLSVLADLCAAAGRPFDEIEKTISTRLNPGESGPEFAERCAGFAELGVDHVIVITKGPWTPDAVRTASAAAA
jgi:alkanesulfonate monooxygenase SsuD/methylene tetrahydromethanopterin reductase-like flavin-dependent oxidoreductase (luciferase family)